ncbi:hypothetical protein Acsp01_87140 [Actinoplanes sp. NBRC 101535]|nr:hypothetical protein Acsp01_87140 [Actinoplanes sp. NBRC 101535]
MVTQARAGMLVAQLVAVSQVVSAQPRSALGVAARAGVTGGLRVLPFGGAAGGGCSWSAVLHACVSFASFASFGHPDGCGSFPGGMI